MSKNKIGIKSTGHHLLVKTDRIEEKTKGGIYLAPQSMEQERRAATTGILVDIGPSAWQEFADGQPWAKVGDRVSYAKFAGIEMMGDDGKDYVLLNDQDVLAVLGL